MDKGIVWSKTVLSVYRYLGRIAGALDKIFEAKAMSGHAFSKYYSLRTSAEHISEALINLSDRKITLINLKLITEKALLRIDRCHARLLVLKYVEGKNGTEIAKHFGISTRTYFRRLNMALMSFTRALFILGYDVSELENMLISERWIKEVYNRYDIPETDENVIDENFMTRLCNRFRKVAVSL